MIELAVDNTNVSEFPHANLNDIAAMARKFADDLESTTRVAISSARRLSMPRYSVR